MIGAAIAFFAAHIKTVCLVCGLSSACGYVILNRRQFQLSGVITTGFLGASVPIGMLLVMASFLPALTDELRKFPLETGVLGLAYIVYAVREIAKNYKQ